MARVIMLAAILLVMIVPAARAATAVGTVGEIQGDCQGTSAGVTQRLAAGMKIFLGEVVATAAGARLQLVFSDGTKLAIGEKARITIDSFIFNPGSTTNRMRLAITGPFRFVSGKIERAPRGDVAVDTPVATIGVRGTDFWGGPIDGAFGVFLIVGRVVVSNAAGSATLNRSGEGVNIAGPGSAPGAVSRWPSDKVDRALATVTIR